ncbi:MAG: amidase [Alphaproteobacteria bacterium]|nr:amidase [Alphaproteobacteria bacterium]MCB9930619.1 amidase [Alphaproteobacteria bacterium]
MSDDLCFMSAAEAGRKIAAKQLSSAELTDALLARTEALDGRLNAYIEVLGDAARASARAADDAVAKGEIKGPLHGVPVALKDIIDLKGVRTTAHSKLLLDNVATSDAFVTARLKEAGCVITGKLSTHEFAIGGPAFDLPFPPARNPWNPEHHPGGSSSGAGSSVAAGMVPVALGSDTGGSVRNPASCCGIVGIKPTYGRVSRAGVIPLSFSLDNVGPLTRTVEDNALMLAAIAGHDPRDPASDKRPVDDYTARLRAGVKGLKIGLIRHFYNEDLQADPEMAESIEATARLLESLGAEVREIRLPPLSQYAACNRVILLAEAYAIHQKDLQTRAGDYAASTRRRLLPGAFVSGADYVNALRMREKLVAAFNEAMEGLDAAVTASSMEPPVSMADMQEVERTYGRQARAPFNLIGNPAIAIPSGFHSNGLPLALQIVGRAFDEAMCFRVAWAVEQELNLGVRRPPL